MSKGKYSVELFKERGEGAGQQEIVDRHDNLQCPGDLSRPGVPVSGPAGHAAQSRSRSRPKRTTADDAVKGASTSTGSARSRRRRGMLGRPMSAKGDRKSQRWSVRVERAAGTSKIKTFHT
jgi:hypothetical protein